VDIDYSTSKAFMLEFGNWGIYVKRDYLNIVKKIFGNIPLIKRILDKKDIFWGPHIDCAPDIILVPEEHVFFSGGIHEEPIYKRYIGEHEPHALIAFYGDDILASNSVNDRIKVTIYDLTPTILAYVGFPLPSNSDGRPLTEAFSIELPSIKKRANYLRRFRLLHGIKELKFRG